MVSPSLIVILIVAAFPIAYAIWLSLHQYSVIHPGLSRWVGLDNYRDALGRGDFWSAVKTTFIFTAISVSLELVLGMGMALLMHAGVPRTFRVTRRGAGAMGDLDGGHRTHVAVHRRAGLRLP